ncbi:hypothetical protein PCH_Pc22g04630 [Penicillium rubens Wisconsin 54-1255]|uniref:Uncharacterized protein n=1 Tax=Penicillium rubens (strain ATCC 28089 / DSM 1075 / NRRL 1951 / Wisconsin 54-1255) TaxID=500485 RepID=B6HTG6_PENRW|nr:hypothetical protein PCH_Pc22g04630 [Penicillium rubens Wisconsin 54-1255]
MVAQCKTLMVQYRAQDGDQIRQKIFLRSKVSGLARTPSLGISATKLARSWESWDFSGGNRKSPGYPDEFSDWCHKAVHEVHRAGSQNQGRKGNAIQFPIRSMEAIATNPKAKLRQLRKRSPWPKAYHIQTLGSEQTKEYCPVIGSFDFPPYIPTP